MSANTRRRRSLARQLRAEIRTSIATIEGQPGWAKDARACGQLEALRHVLTVIAIKTFDDKPRRGPLCNCGTCPIHPWDDDPAPESAGDEVVEEHADG